MKTFWNHFRGAARVWYDADGDHKAATVSYYTIFAIVPLLLLSVALQSLVFGREFLLYTLSDWGSVLGDDVVLLLTDAVRNLEALSVGYGLPVVGIIFFSTMVVMMFNTFTTGIHGMWGIRHRGFWGWVRKSKHSIAFVVVFEAYLFCMLSVSYVLSLMPELPWILLVLYDALFFLFATVTLFALAYKILPWQTPRRISCVWGALVSTILLYIARALVALYISLTPIPGLYGVAGLLVAVLMWVFVSSAVVYFGAAFAFVHADRQLK